MGNTRTYQDIKAQEYRVFSTIPGMNELLHASPTEKPEVEAKYPDAVFVVVIKYKGISDSADALI